MNKWVKIIILGLLIVFSLSPLAYSIDGSSYAPSNYKSSQCIECHFSNDHPDAPQLSQNRGHHPWGKTWAYTSCAVCHASPPFRIRDTLVLDGFQEDGPPLFSCISCHIDHMATIEDNPATVVDGNPSYLRYASFRNDDTAFCEYCHNSRYHPKNRSLLAANDGKHYKTRQDRTNPITRTFKATTLRPEKQVKCGGCMFCHFMHPNEQDDPRDTRVISDQRADLKALIRVPPRELDWGPQGDIVLRPDPLDRYEALCYGCHGDPSIVGDYGKMGSLLEPTQFFSHRFACKPSGVNTVMNISKRGLFPLADGRPGAGPGLHGARDDYGTVQGQIYCGTCHDVHINTKQPYLYRLNDNDTASPYEPDGFCEQCHCTPDNPDPLAGASTHPVGSTVVPKTPITANEFPARLSGGGSGSPDGITAGDNTSNDGIICLTCHNVHAASTSWDGIVPGEAHPSNGMGKGRHGQLLVMDNYSGTLGSNLCLACHNQYGQTEPIIYYLDNDSDGYGDANHSQQEQAGKYTALKPGDIDDTDPAVYPEAPEICDNQDNNGNGLIDEGVTNIYYQDADADGYGNPNESQQACSAPSGYVSNGRDRDDSKAIITLSAYKGDLDQDEKITETDATLALKIAVGKLIPSEYQQWAGTLNEDQYIDSGDAVLILQTAKGIKTTDQDKQSRESLLRKRDTSIYPAIGPYESTKCGGCHISKCWPAAPKLSLDRAHHPMGHTWDKTSCATCHTRPPVKSDGSPLIVLDGFDEEGNPLPPDQRTFSCTSCHGAHFTAIEGNPYFLRYASFKDDDTAFCEYCHNSPKHPKNRSLLAANGGMHYKTRQDPDNPLTRTFKATSKRPETKVKCGGCMFCHFVHQNDDDPRVIPDVSPNRPDIRALMRVPAKEPNSQTADTLNRSKALDSQTADTLNRYEALCYGCHADPAIVDGQGNPTGISAACKPAGVYTIVNIGQPGEFPLADGRPGAGPPDGVRNDYGTITGQVYCGTCHDVHSNTTPPYLRYRPPSAQGYARQTGLIVPISINKALGVAGADISLSYDPNAIEVQEIKPASLIQGFLIQSHIEQGKVNISMANSTGLTSDNGKLLEIIVNLAESVETETTISIENLRVYNEKAEPMATISGDGEIQIGDQCSGGDINQDGEVTPADALLVFWCYLGTGPCSGCADVNKDGQVSPADALCIFKNYLTLPGCLD